MSTHFVTANRLGHSAALYQLQRARIAQPDNEDDVDADENKYVCGMMNVCVYVCVFVCVCVCVTGNHSAALYQLQRARIAQPDNEDDADADENKHMCACVCVLMCVCVCVTDNHTAALYQLRRARTAQDADENKFVFVCRCVLMCVTSWTTAKKSACVC
jgi:hypothetical protein